MLQCWQKLHLFGTQTIGTQTIVGSTMVLGLLCVPWCAAEPPTINQERVVAAGIRKLQSRHLTLYTDLPESPAIQEILEIFDLAVSQWTTYFDLEPQQTADWHATGRLIGEKKRFSQAGLLNDRLPNFKNGYNINDHFWLYEQDSDYYRRHLTLHEGTHAFMQRYLGSTGPPWYMEGTAELLATHQWKNGKLTLKYFPADKRETPLWGRIRIIKDEVKAGRPMRLIDIMKYDPTAHARNEAYGWCWAAAVFFDTHPQYQAIFRQLKDQVKTTENQFNRNFYETLRTQWRNIREEWQLFVINVEYGYDIPRSAIERTPAKSLTGSKTVAIRADRSWQSTGIRVDSAAMYQLRATGQIEVAQESKPWICEPGGVTIRYHDKMPLGRLVAGVSDDQVNLRGTTPLAKPISIGLERQLSFPKSGTLYLRVNESTAGLHDNRGNFQVTIERL